MSLFGFQKNECKSSTLAMDKQYFNSRILDWIVLVRSPATPSSALTGPICGQGHGTGKGRVSPGAPAKPPLPQGIIFYINIIHPNTAASHFLHHRITDGLG